MKHYGIDEDLEKKAEILKAIGHPVRLCIVKNLLNTGEHNVSEMQDCLCIPQSTVSQHVSKLKSAGIIGGKRKKNEILYAVVDEDVRKILEALFKKEEK